MILKIYIIAYSDCRKVKVNFSLDSNRRFSHALYNYYPADHWKQPYSYKLNFCWLCEQGRTVARSHFHLSSPLTLGPFHPESPALPTGPRIPQQERVRKKCYDDCFFMRVF